MVKKKEEINGMSKERYLACEILETFEDFLAARGINIPNKEREEYFADGGENRDDPDNCENNPQTETDGAILFGSDYYLLEDGITTILEKGLKKYGK